MKPIAFIFTIILIITSVHAQPVHKSLKSTVKKVVNKKVLLTESRLFYPLYELKTVKLFSKMMVNGFETEYYRKNNHWFKSEFYLYNGRRNLDVYNNVPEPVVTIFNALLIQVRDDLSVYFYYNTKENNNWLIGVPYNNDSMFYSLSLSPSQYNCFAIPKNLKPSTKLIDNYLYLYANDKLDEIDFDFTKVTYFKPSCAVIRYDIKLKEFELTLCDELNVAIFRFSLFKI